MKTFQTYLLAAVIVLLGVAAYFLFGNLAPYELQKPAVGDSAPAISLQDLGGVMVRLSDFRGKIVLLNFWANWCPPCKEEMPGFQKVFESYNGKGFAVIAVAVDDVSPSAVRELGILFPVVIANNRISRDYKVDHIPASFLIGKDGRIIKKVKGMYSESDLRSDVEQALKRQAPKSL